MRRDAIFERLDFYWGKWGPGWFGAEVAGG